MTYFSKPCGKRNSGNTFKKLLIYLVVTGRDGEGAKIENMRNKSRNNASQYMFTIFNVINITNHLSKKVNLKKTSENFKTLKNKRPMRRAKKKKTKRGWGAGICQGSQII